MATPPPISLDSSDPLNLIIHTTPMDENKDSNSNPPDWSQLTSLWPEQDNSPPNSKPQFNDYLDFNMASNMLDLDFDMSLNGNATGGATAAGGIEPSALHLDRLGYPSYDDPFTFPASASPADILAAQFPFTFQPDAVMDGSGLQTPNTNQRRLSVTSSSSSSGQSFSPAPESIASPGYGYTSDSTQQSFATPELPLDHSFGTDPPAAAPRPVTAAVVSPSSSHAQQQQQLATSANPAAAELAYRVSQSAGVMRAVPMNGNSPFPLGQQIFPSPNSLQAKLPIPRLQQQQRVPKSVSPSSTSSAASTPPPSTPPSTTNESINRSSTNVSAAPTTTNPTTAAAAAAAAAVVNTTNNNNNNNNRPKTSHTTIERRYRTNLNARIQSLRMAVPALRVLEDRDSNGSSKKIKKNLKGGVLIKSSSSSSSTSSSSTSPSSLSSMIAVVPGDPSPSNPYGEVDMIDERGYVDGVKVARKCSKANVLGKAVEYIRVLKRREGRLRTEQEGLKTLLCGLVGGPALLREWEREWRERFGGEERDEVDPEERDVDDDDEGDEDDVVGGAGGGEELEDEDGGGGGGGEVTGKKRKRAKVDLKDSSGVVPVVKKEPKAPSVVVIGADGQPEKRKRGRPRKVPVLQGPVVPSNGVMPTTEQQQQQPQQYLLAVFALFSFFNSPLTSSSPSSSASHTAPHTHQGHVLSPPLAYAPDIISQFTPPSMPVTVTWRDWVQVAHLAVTVLLFISVLIRMAESFGFGRVMKLVKGAAAASPDDAAKVNKKVERITLGTESATSLTSALILYRSISPNTSPILKPLFLYTLASKESTPGFMKYLLKLRAEGGWMCAASVVGLAKKEQIVLSTPLEKVFSILPSIRLTASLAQGEKEEEEELVDLIAAYIIKQKLGHVLGKMFVHEVTGSPCTTDSSTPNTKQEKKGEEKEAVAATTTTTAVAAVGETTKQTTATVAAAEISDQEIEAIIEAAKGLGGEVSLLAKNVERVRTPGVASSSSSSSSSSSTSAAVIGNGWSASPMSPQSLIDTEDDEEEDEGNDSDHSSSSSYSSLSHSLLSEDSILGGEEEEEEEGEEGSGGGGMVDPNMPFTILRALVLYRSLFSSSSSSSPSSSSAPTISIEPPTPTIPSPLLSHLHTRTTTPTTATAPKNLATSTAAAAVTATTTAKTTAMGNGQRKRMYALRKLLGSRVFEKDEVEDARDRVVDMLVEAERRSARS